MQDLRLTKFLRLSSKLKAVPQTFKKRFSKLPDKLFDEEVR